MEIIDEQSSFGVPLSKITLAASTKRAFKFINNKSFTTGLLIRSCQENIIIKQGTKFPQLSKLDVFAKYEDFDEQIFDELIVLLCEPLFEGLLSIKTSIIVIDAEPQICVGDMDNKKHYNNVPHMSTFLNVYHCTQNTKYSPGQFLEAIILHKADDNWIESSLKVVTSYKIFLECWNGDEKVTTHGNQDVNNAIIISEKLAQKYGLFNSDYLEVRLNNQDKYSTNKSRCVLFLLKISKNINCIGEVEDQCLYVPANAYHSLQVTYSCVSEENIPVFLKRYSSPLGSASNCSISSVHVPPFASEIHISCVHSPSYNSQDSFTDLLQWYFKVPRLVRKNGVICINSKDDPEFWQNVTESSEHRYPVIYFKVTQLLPKLSGCNTYLVDSNHTNLYLENPVSSFVPSVMSFVVRENTGFIVPPGLQEYVNQLLQILSPYVKARERKRQIYPSLLISGNSGCGKTSLVSAVAAKLNFHCYQVNCHELTGDTSGATEARIKHTVQRAQAYCPCILLLRNIHVLGKDRDGTADDLRVSHSFHELTTSLLHENNLKYPTLLIATTPDFKSLSADMNEGFLHHIEIGVPNESSRLEITKTLFKDMELQKDINLSHVAKRTAGFVLGDFTALVSEVKRTAYSRIVIYCKEALCGRYLTWKEECHVRAVGYPIIQEDIDNALDALQAAHSDSLGAPKIPNVQWDDVGGLGSVKSEILDTIQLPLQHPELFAQGLRRSGVLFYGPPGTGKTLLAKAVATECSLNFLSVKGPELINMYVGQSEENIREVFHRARNASPCVIFFDELDSLAPNRGRSGDSGGVMDRVVSQLLAELDGLHKSEDVFVIGATNRPDLLDPALLRPGRFDKLLFLGVSEDRDSQLKIIKALTRKFTLDKDCDLEEVVRKCPFNMTGADFYALCSDAMLNGLKRKIVLLESGDRVDQSSVSVCYEDFVNALASLVPSVSEEELKRYRMVQETFENNKKAVEFDN